jgi:hypothetical protein
MSENQWASWEAAFEGLPPVGYMLRKNTSIPWIRLYALPGGERLPTTPEGMSEVLARENLVASCIIGVGATVTAWMTHYGEKPPLVELAQWTWAPEPPPWRADQADLETLEGSVFLERTLTWRAGALDAELRLRALDEIGPLTVFSPALGNAFCPYDGGMDVFLQTPEAVASIRRLFPDWISTHPQGL